MGPEDRWGHEGSEVRRGDVGGTNEESLREEGQGDHRAGVGGKRCETKGPLGRTGTTSTTNGESGGAEVCLEGGCTGTTRVLE